MKKILCVLLAALMAATCMVACTDTEDKPQTSNSSTVTTESAGEFASQLPEAVDMGGYEFNILERWFGYGKQTINFEGEVIWIDDESGKLSNLSLSKKKVLDTVQTNYNCTITGEITTATPQEMRDMIIADVSGRTGEYDFCFEAPYYYYGLVQDGNLVNLKDLGIDFSKPWWDANAVKDLSICNELYYALGDINTYDNDGTFVCFFNKTLFKEVYPDKDFKDLYKLAADGKWTFDVLKEYAEGVGKDLDGNNTRDEKDQYGLMTETSNIYLQLIASGNKIATKDAEDKPVFALQNEQVYKVIEDTVDFYLKSNDVLVADLEQYVKKYDGQDVYEHTVINGFKEGRGLFYICGLIHLSYLAEMDDDFGILPVPKYTEAQDRYYHNMSYATSSAVFVPENGRDFAGKDGQYLAIVLDALGAYSKDIVTPVYYEQQLKRKNAPDKESGEMLDIVFESRSFDLGTIYSVVWGDLMATITTLDKGIQSRIEMKAAATIKKMQVSVEKIEASQNK